MAMALAARGDFLVVSVAGVDATTGGADLTAVDLTGFETVVVTDLDATLLGRGFLATGGLEAGDFETTAF